MKHYSKNQLQRIAQELFKPTAKKENKPSKTLLRVRTATTALLAKMKTTKAPAVAPITPQQNTVAKRSFLNRYLPTMAVNPSDLKAITQNELQALTDAELNLLKLQIEQAQRQRGYNKNRGNN
ncbi:hypothetical protein [Flavobacterium sp. WC2429]|uniref:Uncharacterized protein n=1 Tax=Flavobacterium sp. WC2429 TaxID=3234140 RepID=A0AB39WM63_9FLAO